MIENTILTNISQETEDITVIPATFYYRWSTPGQLTERKFKDNTLSYEEKEKTLKEWEEKLRAAIDSYKAYCPKCGKVIRTVYAGKGYFDKGETGRKADREQIEQLLEDVNNNSFHAVFTPYSSRIGRRRSVSATIRDKLKDSGIQLYSIQEPTTLRCPDCYDQWDDNSAILNETLSDFQAEIDLRNIRQNYKNGMPIRIKSGKPSGSLAYGLIKKYKVITNDARGSDVIEEYYEWDDSCTKIVKRIADEYFSGLGTWKISQRLNDENIPSPQGKKWGRTAILCILRNPAFAGWVRFGWKIVKRGKRVIQSRDKWLLVKASYEGIWDLTFYDKIEAEIARRATVGGRAISSDGLLIGMLKCGHCKYSMFQAKSSKKRDNGFIYRWRGYACGTFMHRGACQHNGKAQTVVDKLVLQEVLKLANDNARRAFYQKLSTTKVNNLSDKLNEAKTRLEKLENEFERITLAYRSGADSLEEYANNKNEVLPKINEARGAVEKLSARVKQAPTFSWEMSYEKAIIRFFNHPTQEDKRTVRTILLRLIDRIEVKRKPLHIKIFYKLDS